MKRLCLFLLTLSLLIDCQKKIEKTEKVINSGSEIKVTDFRNKTISLSSTAEKVVCLIESALSGIFMLRAQHKVVGISTNVYTGDVARQYAALDERIRLKKLPAPGNWDFVNLENVIALKPDLVIIWASQTETIAALERLGIPVYGIMLKSINDVYKEIRDFGILLDA
ncbi:MAG: ABC transporter substrate-binding protein, partial [Chitinispirillaceae bacterium]|nr:ABC transporter substrate-binding protein [Chitinispirillaceae bacterium]